jgi:hypothetical protein
MFRLSDAIIRCGTIAAVLLIAVPAGAVDKEALPPSTPSHQTVPEADSPKSGGSGEPLSDKLDRQDGVLRPPGGIDSAMPQKPPAEGKTPVIRPPGTLGGEQGIQPK